jgi:hypothetical protein
MGRFVLRSEHEREDTPLTHPRRVALALIAVVAGIEPVRADVFTVPLPGTAVIPSTIATPYTFTTPSQPAVTNLLGYSLQGNWTTTTGAVSADLRMAIQPPAGALSPYQRVGGLFDSNPFAFGTFINNGASYNVPLSGLRSFPAGDFTVNMFQAEAGTASQVANGTVSIFSNPSGIPGTPPGGPTFRRPDIGTGTDPGTPMIEYAVNRLTVSASGRYMFVNETVYDGVVMLFANSFNPASPTPVVNAGDYDVPPFTGFGDTFVADLEPGLTYFLVSTGYSPGDAGPYTAYAAGPGLVTFNPVPEPGSVLLAAGAVLAGGVWVRRGVTRRAVARS